MARIISALATFTVVALCASTITSTPSVLGGSSKQPAQLDSGITNTQIDAACPSQTDIFTLLNNKFEGIGADIPSTYQLNSCQVVKTENSEDKFALNIETEGVTCNINMTKSDIDTLTSVFKRLSIDFTTGVTDCAFQIRLKALEPKQTDMPTPKAIVTPEPKTITTPTTPSSKKVKCGAENTLYAYIEAAYEKNFKNAKKPVYDLDFSSLNIYKEKCEVLSASKLGGLYTYSVKGHQCYTTVESDSTDAAKPVVSKKQIDAIKLSVDKCMKAFAPNYILKKKLINQAAKSKKKAKASKIAAEQATTVEQPVVAQTNAEDEVEIKEETNEEVKEETKTTTTPLLAIEAEKPAVVEDNKEETEEVIPEEITEEEEDKEETKTTTTPAVETETEEPKKAAAATESSMNIEPLFNDVEMPEAREYEDFSSTASEEPVDINEESVEETATPVAEEPAMEVAEPVVETPKSASKIETTVTNCTGEAYVKTLVKQMAAKAKASVPAAFNVKSCVYVEQKTRFSTFELKFNNSANEKTCDVVLRLNATNSGEFFSANAKADFKSAMNACSNTFAYSQCDNQVDFFKAFSHEFNKQKKARGENGEHSDVELLGCTESSASQQTSKKQDKRVVLKVRYGVHTCDITVNGITKKREHVRAVDVRTLSNDIVKCIRQSDAYKLNKMNSKMSMNATARPELSGSYRKNTITVPKTATPASKRLTVRSVQNRQADKHIDIAQYIFSYFAVKKILESKIVTTQNVISSKSQIVAGVNYDITYSFDNEPCQLQVFESLPDKDMKSKYFIYHYAATEKNADIFMPTLSHRKFTMKNCADVYAFENTQPKLAGN